MDLIAADEGTRASKFTIQRSGEIVGAFDTVTEVHEFVRKHPEAEYMIALGDGVSLNSPEVEELRKGWRGGVVDFNEMHGVAFEQYLAVKWSVQRNDMYAGEILPLHELHAGEPVRPGSALKILDVSKREMVSLLRRGTLARPGYLGHGRVAWRFDDVMAAREWIKDIRNG